MSINQVKGDIIQKVTSDGSIDYIQLEESMLTINTIYPFILGFLVVSIMILIPIVISLEIVYICFPIIREGVDELLIRIEGKGKKTSVLGFALRDARKAVTIANTGMVGEQSALWIYLKLKAASLALVVVLIALVVVFGDRVIDFIQSVVEPIVQNFI